MALEYITKGDTIKIDVIKPKKVKAKIRASA